MDERIPRTTGAFAKSADVLHCSLPGMLEFHTECRPDFDSYRSERMCFLSHELSMSMFDFAAAERAAVQMASARRNLVSIDDVDGEAQPVSSRTPSALGMFGAIKVAALHHGMTAFQRTCL